MRESSVASASKQVVSFSDDAVAKEIFSVGEALFPSILPLLEEADPEGTISAQSRKLCASLGALAQACYAELGGVVHQEAVGRAAALLSLLTKLDDQVIDGLGFHGRLHSDRVSVEARVRAYLAPTLRSIFEAKAETAEPRCALAAELGRSLRAISAHPARLSSLLEWIAKGWEIQAQGVAWFSTHPAPQQLAAIEEITAQISGAWLLMITLVGTLPEDASRMLTLDEQEAYGAWGRWIQSADALADFAKDCADGMGNSVAGHRLWLARPARYLDAYKRGDLARLYTMLEETQTDTSLLPPVAAIENLEERLSSLPSLVRMLRWIQRFLIQRYLYHPLCAREPSHPSFAAYTTKGALPSDPWLASYVAPPVEGI